MAVSLAVDAACARRRRLCCAMALVLLAGDAAALDEVLDIGMVVNLDGNSVTVFDQAPLQVRSVIGLPDGSFPIGAAICERDDGTVVGAVGDLGAYVHLLDVLGGRTLARVPVGINAVDVSCCGDYLVVTSGAFLDKRPPAVVDLRRMIEVPQAAALPNGMAAACAASRDRVLLASIKNDRVYRLDLDRTGGMLSDTGDARAASGPVDVEVSPDQRCGAVVEDAAGTLTAFAFPRLSPAASSALPDALSLVDACHGGDYVAVRSTLGKAGRLQVFDAGRDCELAPAPRFERTIGPLVIAQFPGVDTMGCARSGLIFAAADGGDASPAGDAVQVFTAHGHAVGELRHPSIDGPLGIAVFHRRLYAVPALGGIAAALIAGLFVLAAGLHMRRSRPA